MVAFFSFSSHSVRHHTCQVDFFDVSLRLPLPSHTLVLGYHYLSLDNVVGSYLVSPHLLNPPWNFLSQSCQHKVDCVMGWSPLMVSPLSWLWGETCPTLHTRWSLSWYLTSCLSAFLIPSSCISINAKQFVLVWSHSLLFFLFPFGNSKSFHGILVSIFPA